MGNRAIGERRVGNGSGFEFELTMYESGLYMRRHQITKELARIEHSIVFSDQAAFDEWCDADPVMHQDPLLHASLRRCASELFDIRRSHMDAS